MTKSFLLTNGYVFKKDYYNDSMGFLPCDALGSMVYCVYKGNLLVGHSQLDEDIAIEMAMLWHRNQELIKNHVYLIYDKTTHMYTRASGKANQPFLNKQGAKLGIRRLKEFSDLENHIFEIHEFNLRFTHNIIEE